MILRRSLAPEKSFSSKFLKQIIRSKMGLSKKETKKLIKGLINKDLIGVYGKSPVKYYLGDTGRAFRALIDHELTPVGKVHDLK